MQFPISQRVSHLGRHSQPPARSGRRLLPHRPVSRLWVVLAVTVALVATTLSLPGTRVMVASLGGAFSQLNGETLRDGLDSLGIWAPVVYVAIQAAQVLVPFLPAAPVTFAGALLFGWQLGFALSMAGWTLGSVLQFAAVRRWGRPLVVRLIGEQTLDRYAGKLDPRGWWLLVAFLVPFAPADALSALAGLSAMPFRRFLLVSVAGRLPWAAGTVLIAAGVAGGPTVTLLTGAAGGAAALALILAYRRRLTLRLPWRRQVCTHSTVLPSSTHAGGGVPSAERRVHRGG